MNYAEIKQTNDVYNDNSNDWFFYQQSYIGGRRWITTENLFRHSREDQDDYVTRLKRATFVNYCRPIIDIYTSFIFGVETSIARNTEDELYRQLIFDADFQGHSMHNFMETVATFSQVFGYVGIVVDMPKTDIQIVSMADLQASELRPYCTMYDALNIMDWSTDKHNQLNWIRLREQTSDTSDPFIDDVSGLDYQYRTWTKDEWFVHDQDGNMVDAGEHHLGVVPFISVKFKDHPIDNWVGLSQLTDIAPLNRLLTNTVSYIEEFTSKQAFPFLATPDDPIQAGIQQEEEQIISASNVYQFPAGAQPPQYVSPPTDPAAFMKMFASDYLVKEMLRLSHLEFRELAEQSGIAKQYDFHQLNQVLVRFSRTLESAETKIARLFEKWMDKDVDLEVDYPDDFNVRPMDSLLENAELIRTLMNDKSPSFVNAHLRRLMEQIEPKLTPDMQHLIDTEMDEATQTELIMSQLDETAIATNGTGTDVGI